MIQNGQKEVRNKNRDCLRRWPNNRRIYPMLNKNRWAVEAFEEGLDGVINRLGIKD